MSGTDWSARGHLWRANRPMIWQACDPLADCRDRRSLFPESRRPPPGLDSCVCGNGFCVLPPSSRTTLEVRPIDSGALLRFLGGSRPLLADSDEFSSVLTFFRHQAGRCFCHIPIFSKRAKRSKKAIQIPKLGFSKLECICDFLVRLKRFSCVF